ncbi:valine dehydrogenase [Rhodococcus sp. WWJCD1]|uniref:Glu/Leu/Phe/Val family dehydrogenase n=1 Tax=unclassified Rhodococcus (in: high G+C Gram-positive bacteria) TaxID=192944 RepID=UPI000B9A31C1|nr:MULTISPECIES: Glu/Leu/Phe/Val dehydrogenase dimerization domain-containing protein [unclassified Rhodococcus (in: high G+C Gram-positive bacteria)]OZC49039.1 valine dehydrogenase [Rhodococcus sp. WWJCD1]OZE81544.1 valine dehydrogenase [Rhodococcus sp. 15-649-2-2]
MTTDLVDHTLLPTVSGVFDRPDFADDSPHEQVVFCRDEKTGLKAIIGIHSTALGPALGGTRFFPYRDESAALTDVLRLSRGMTYKAAAAGLQLGGGKAVLIGDPALVKTPALLEAYGRFVETLGGRYITAGDVGTTSDDMDIIGRSTDHVITRTSAAGGSGDSAPLTARGVFYSILAAAESVWGSPDLAGRRVGVEGTGKVGYNLIALLAEVGATIVASDVNSAALQRVTSDFPGVAIAETVIDKNIDIYAPCAMGATLTDTTARILDATVVCGAANNQLAQPVVEELLHDKGIVWVPDFVSNSGGLIQGAGEIENKPRREVVAQVERIGATVASILARQQDQGILAGQAADAIVRERLGDACSRAPMR